MKQHKADNSRYRPIINSALHIIASFGQLVKIFWKAIENMGRAIERLDHADALVLSHATLLTILHFHAI